MARTLFSARPTTALSLAATGLVLVLGLTLRPGPEISPGESTFAVLVLLLAAGWVVELARQRTRPALVVAVALLYLGWLAGGLLSALGHGVEPLWWLRRVIVAACFPVLLVVGSEVFDRPSRRRILSLALLVLAACVVTAGLLRGVSFPFFSEVDAEKEMQSFRRAVAAGGGFFAPLLVCLAVPHALLTRDGRHRSLAAAAVTLGVLGVALGFTRTFWLAALAGAATAVGLAAASPGFSRKRLRTLVIAVLLAGLAVVSVPRLRDYVAIRGAQLVEAPGETSLRERLDESRGLLASLDATNVWLGRGLGSRFRFYSESPLSWGRSGWIWNDYAHNYFLFLLHGTGLLGLGLFLALWGLLGRAAWRRLRDPALGTGERSAVIGLSSVLVCVAVSSLAVPVLMKVGWAALTGTIAGALALSSRPRRRRAPRSAAETAPAAHLGSSARASVPR